MFSKGGLGPLETLPRSPLRRSSRALAATPQLCAFTRKQTPASHGAPLRRIDWIRKVSLLATARSWFCPTRLFQHNIQPCKLTGPHRALFQQLDLIRRWGEDSPLRAERAQRRAPPTKKKKKSTERAHRGFFCSPHMQNRKRKKKSTKNKHLSTSARLLNRARPRTSGARS